MLIKKQPDISGAEITDPEVYFNRRRFIQAAAIALGGSWLHRQPFAATADQDNCTLSDLPVPDEAPNTLSEISRYNNYYEFTTKKDMVLHYAKELPIDGWILAIEGECEKPFTIGVEDLLAQHTQEERIYRFRCVEGWSMVIPWSGFSLCELLKQAQPTSKAKYVEFVSLHDPKNMIGQRMNTLQWPYREGLRIDEAMHPLTMMVTGLYGKELPKQNGAPLRIAVPWKYGFKSPKAITHIRFTEQEPKTSWREQVPSEYGFYANVNPNVAHPRWSQSRENRVGEMKKRRTLMFNGYEDQVAHLYKGMDLEKFF
jgi:sulfoxide reductase catalytic subunit YedY